MARRSLGLDIERELADLVEEERAAVRGLEFTAAAAVRAREGAFFGAKEFGLEQTLGHRGAVHRDKGPAPAFGKRVQRAGGELLTGPALTRST